MMMQKADLRSQMKAARHSHPRGLLPATLLQPYFNESAILAGFWPMASEIDVRPALETWHHQGGTVALPRVVDGSRILQFHRWKPGLTLQRSVRGIMQPAPEWEPLTPTILLVPGLAFTQSGNRIGYGGGYYDATLADLRSTHKVTAIGICQTFQLVEVVPTEPCDEGLDKVLVI